MVCSVSINKINQKINVIPENLHTAHCIGEIPMIIMIKSLFNMRIFASFMTFSPIIIVIPQICWALRISELDMRGFITIYLTALEFERPNESWCVCEEDDRPWMWSTSATCTPTSTSTASYTSPSGTQSSENVSKRSDLRLLLGFYWFMSNGRNRQLSDIIQFVSTSSLFKPRRLRFQNLTLIYGESGPWSLDSSFSLNFKPDT